MTKQERQTKLLQMALNEAKFWLIKIPKLDHYMIGQHILDSVVSKFKEHQEVLWKYECYEVADLEYEVKVNSLGRQTLLIQRKEVDDV